MSTINPYLNFIDKTEEAFNFYKSVFGGEFVAFQRFKDMPQQEDGGCAEVSDADKERILHVALPIGESNVLMGSDCPQSMETQMSPGNCISISINTDSEEETKRLFGALSEGGEVKMPLDKTFWNAYFGMCVDKFGVAWMVNYDYNQKQ